MIWIIGGTSEASELIKKIKGKKEYIVTVATYSGKEVLEDENVVISRIDEKEMMEFIKNHDIDMIIDMSHPYAVEVTRNAKIASKTCEIKYLRYVRKKSCIDDAIYLGSFDECLKFLAGVKGCVFITTGMKNIRDYEKVRGSNRFVYRVLPTAFSIEECLKNNLKMKDIIAILGPVSKELNMAMFREYKADYVVMKDSGKEGGTIEKIDACRELGIVPVIIGRDDESGIHDMNELLEMIM